LEESVPRMKSTNAGICAIVTQVSDSSIEALHCWPEKLPSAHRYFLAALANHVVPRQVARIDRVGLSTLNSSRFTLLGARMGTQRRQNASTRRSHVGQPLRPASKDLSLEEFELREVPN
jgi:hypothetical protein